MLTDRQHNLYNALEILRRSEEIKEAVERAGRSAEAFSLLVYELQSDRTLFAPYSPSEQL